MAYELEIFSPFEKQRFLEALRPAFAALADDDDGAARGGYPRLRPIDDLDEARLGASAPAFRTKVNLRGQAFLGALVEKRPDVVILLETLVRELPGAVAIDDYSDEPLPLADWVRAAT